MDKYRDLARRAFWTFVQTALSVGLIGPVLEVEVEAWELAALSGAAASLSVLKSFAAKQLQHLDEDSLE